ncbi:MAG: hypothetical protein JWP89_4354 [Schlesneria sp.]|nr:hypothetical protein [Schlesneria sp.]
MSATLPANRYSADVALSLHIGDRTIRLSQVAPNFVVLAESIELPQCDAEIHVSVDGNVHRRNVFLIDGIKPSMVRVRIETRPAN